MNRQPLAEQVYDSLRYQIVRLTLAPGQWVTERGLAAELGVGLAPLRAAMARLSNEGLLVTVPRRGYRVADLTVEDADHLFAAWRLVAVEVVRLATLAMTPKTVAAYSAFIDRVSTSADSTGRDRLEVVLGIISERWHFLAEMAGNAYLSEILMRLEIRVSRVCVLGLSVNVEMEALAMNAGREAAIIKVFRNRDADASVALINAEMERIQRDIHQAFDSLPAPQQATHAAASGA